MKKIIFTGGGTAGHVIVNTVLIPYLIECGWEIIYIGAYNGVEKQMISQIEGVTYYGISTGKLRRYISIENLKDIFRVLKGIGEAYKIIRSTKAQMIFSCGGFVSVPVVLGGWMARVPSIIRETDYTVGLANRICIPFCKKVCVTFEDTLKDQLPNIKRAESGMIIREELGQGSREVGLRITEFSREKPILLVQGGSQGADVINHTLRQALPQLLDIFQIIHLCGRGKADAVYEQEGYMQYEYVEEELKHFYAMADIIVGRAGSNSICEGIVLNKPMLLIPLSKKASRGDQILNAQYIVRRRRGKMLVEDNLTPDTLVEEITKLYHNQNQYQAKNKVDITKNILDQILLIEQAI